MKIEKLNILDNTVNCVDYEGLTHCVVDSNAIDTINEIITFINNLQNPKHAYETPEAKTEQESKWIGKLCDFWDDDERHKTIGVLDSIGDYDLDYPYFNTNGGCFRHCRPVEYNENLFFKTER